MLRIALVMASVACSGGPDPHAPGVCRDWVDGNGSAIATKCERACETMPMETGSACSGSDPDGGSGYTEMPCQRTFTFEGTAGCCIGVLDVGGNPSIRVLFYECR